MSGARYLGRERTLAAEKSAKYLGSASIYIENLRFLHEEDKENVERLKQLFRSTGYDRSDVRNHVPATIDKEILDAALQYSGISSDRLNLATTSKYPKLDFPSPHRLECLHGIDRIQAAISLLPPGDKRWVVDLYQQGSLPCISLECYLTPLGISHELRTAIAEEYMCEKEPEDGEFYSKIRQYQQSGDKYFEDGWWARLAALGGQKKKNLKRILKDPVYTSAFDCQLDMPGLSGGMRLGTIHTMFSMRCSEVSGRTISYLSA